MFDGKQHIGIIGGGKMGTSLFNYLSGFDISITWYRRTHADKAQNKFERRLKRQLKNDVISELAYQNKLQHQKITDNFDYLSEPDILIECIKEDLSEKIALFTKLDIVANKNAIIASNSSSILPSQLQLCCKRISKVVGLHFFYPVEMKNIVEFITNTNTTAETVFQIESFLTSIDKFYLRQDESNAFILNRLMLNLQAGAYQLSIQENISFAEIDTAVRKNLFPMGIFEMLDHIGIDVMYQSVNNYVQFEKEKEFYLPLLKVLHLYHTSNKLGIKTGEGFYKYENNKSDLTNQTSFEERRVTSFLIDIYNRAVENILAEKKCTANDLEFAMNEYLDTDTAAWKNVVMI